ncbi:MULTISPECIES: hypothetical protein [unclassified Sphingomonas]|jgi:hypothetical protein|uniref:hypothetical protein n=1 Tax=unclassified Sphingomonas TaxID=196159 RepID=UPI00104655C6|nr:MULTISPECIES: hypothetical protein [unclassified Sphingomonas]TCQ00210.1 hypothetical protein C8J46_102351 [Sphingomonas sp. PP-F2F-A104-K0414]TCQ10935.1 hypothetical protein C8J40_101319 [Sphingomonas sp. PP-CC-3A-396]
MKFRFKNVAVTAAGAAMMVAPTMASAANPARSLSVARTGTATSGKGKLAEGPTATYVSIGILAALVVGVLLATSGGDDSSDSN